jgi:hypothetical protein
MSDSIPTITLNGDGKLSPNPKHLKLHASLTAPESEDWMVIPNKNRTLIIAMRDLPEKHELGVLSIYVTTDAEAAGTHTLLSKLSDLGKRKSFNVLSVVLPRADTKQCIRCLDPVSSSSQDFEGAPFVLMTFH